MYVISLFEKRFPVKNSSGEWGMKMTLLQKVPDVRSIPDLNFNKKPARSIDTKENFYYIDIQLLNNGGIDFRVQ